MKITDIITESKRTQSQRSKEKCWPGKHKEGTKASPKYGPSVRVNNCVPNESIDEAANAAQQAAIAIAMKKKGKTPKNEAEGTPEGLPHLTKELVQHILEQVKTEGPHAICKSIEWGDGAAEELLEYIVQSLEHWEPQVDEDWQKANKHDKTDGMSRKAVKAYRREHPGSKLQTAVTTKPSKLKAGSKDAKRRKSFCARMSGNPGPMKDEKGRPTPKAKALRRWNCE